MRCISLFLKLPQTIMVNLFTDIQDSISNALFNFRQSIYNSYTSATKDIQNPLIIVDKYATESYSKSKSIISNEEQKNIVPAFWVFTISTVLGTKLLPRFKLVGVAAMTMAIGIAYFPKTIQVTVQELKEKWTK